jgi:methionine-rich copper-binding protein CopC
MNRNLLIVLIVLAVVLAGGAAYYFSLQREKINDEISAPLDTFTPSPSTEAPDFVEIKSAHFVSSSPANNTTLTTPPAEIKLNFNFVLASNSSLRLFRNRTPIGTNTPIISTDKLTMTVPFPTDSGPGSYLVEYTACWPDKSCHDGSFGFVINQ